jgi:hypothetical protein
MVLPASQSTAIVAAWAEKQKPARRAALPVLMRVAALFIALPVVMAVLGVRT